MVMLRWWVVMVMRCPSLSGWSVRLCLALGGSDWVHPLALAATRQPQGVWACRVRRLQP
ncbi:hypothetical protein BN11_1960029 [Nostocoides australiense Ben110]|uniref:Uncharacterized protein n=1 Tax=Nostocoides australiense Ben110 TaxID=1193182 RepID=W6JVS5_9MICO|nr:hypothetical protein BN11_1960029 [Tetrasphaera australiensis Ben110]